MERFIDLKTGEIFNAVTAVSDVQNLRNLFAVADAEVSMDTLATGVLVTYEVQEALTLFPIVSFGSVRENLWFQLGFTDVNWRGRGNQFTAYYLNNEGRHNGAVYYQIPYWGRSRFGTSFSFLRWASVEPTYFPEGTVIYNYAFTSIGGSGIYEIARDHTLEIGGNFFQEYYEKLPEQELIDPPGPDELSLPKLLLKATHRVSSINYHFFYLEGEDNTLQTESVYNLTEGSWFHVIKNDFRLFRRVKKKGNFGLRFRVGFSDNIATPFAPFVLDSQLNIRGAGNRRDRGTAAVVLNLEYRHAVYDVKGKNFALQAVGFSDMGSWRSPGGNLEELVQGDEVQFFMGGGLRFIYKKAHNAILRIDYGIDIFDMRRRGFVLGAGQYF